MRKKNKPHKSFVPRTIESQLESIGVAPVADWLAAVLRDRETRYGWDNEKSLVRLAEALVAYNEMALQQLLFLTEGSEGPKGSKKDE